VRILAGLEDRVGQEGSPRVAVCVFRGGIHSPLILLVGLGRALSFPAFTPLVMG